MLYPSSKFRRVLESALCFDQCSFWKSLQQYIVIRHQEHLKSFLGFNVRGASGLSGRFTFTFYLLFFAKAKKEPFPFKALMLFHDITIYYIQQSVISLLPLHRHVFVLRWGCKFFLDIIEA
mmetsp:Transcript_27648/g.55345  ORF Transcript_27648/g.55345 Transcript_27648/m.55345 type:complete len:121 (-) Transcript_27648:135-497(-)